MAEQEYLKSQEDHSMPRKGVTKYATKWLVIWWDSEYTSHGQWLCLH
jgi:hypothetical protein